MEALKPGINLWNGRGGGEMRQNSTCDMPLFPSAPPPPAALAPSFLTAPSQRCGDQFDDSGPSASALPAHPAQTSPPLGCFDHAQLVCCNFLPLPPSLQSLSGSGSGGRQKGAPRCQTINMLLIM